MKLFAGLLFCGLLAALSAGVAQAAGVPQRFEVGQGTFLLDGKPFVVKAAEIHYPRIPEAYWEHRIQMCKALGMNTICLYIFWNYHEREPGKFDFTGNGDIARFCRLAQKHGMYVIVRPGPYVCAEWEMGGLPWWLLKKQDIRLRSLDPDYMAAVRRFMAAVGKELAPLQLSRGGNILMVQVENEFGAYAVDKPYIREIRNIVRDSGFTDSLLFQCDWSSTYRNNGLEDLLWTLNFGTGADIDAQFSAPKQDRPDTPLMCSEFWSGWFDHWGRKHETRDAETMVRGISDMLARNISFSLYMTHGGTTFGWWGGANNPDYSAMCTSYDYDAPISEAGHVTPKFEKLRTLLQQYATEPLPEPPAAPEVIAVAPFHLERTVSLFDALPEAKHAETIRPMEAFDQGWGTILYTTTLPRDAKAGELLEIDEVHDWAQVFVDGRLIARLDRRKREFSCTLPEALPAGTKLDILVEAMGRVNFGWSIHDRKGITNAVRLGGEALANWQVRNLPPEFFATAAAQAKPGQTEGPAWWVGSFTVEKPGDTFLDMSTWGKGMVWVNGRALGRFWEIGPQQTLFLPGCWLKARENEVVVLDLKGPREAQLQGLTEPVLDVLRGNLSPKHRKAGETLDLAGETAIFSGSVARGGAWQTLTFPAAKGRYLALEVLSVQGEGPAAIAEVELVGADGKKLPREKWSARYATSEEVIAANATADKLYDLQESTYWASEAGAALPQVLVLDLGEEVEAHGIQLLPRAEPGAPGQIKDFRLYLKSEPFAVRAE